MPAVSRATRSAALAFGADGALYVSGGDGASFNFADYGQDGSPLNPCGDPPGGVGGDPDAADCRGRRAAQPGPAHDGRPESLDGAVLRVDPATAPGLPDNPLAFSADANARRIVAYGLRNPFRITSGRARTRSGSATSAGTPGRRSTGIEPDDAAVENFGWPCYEGAGRQSGYDGANLNLCENLYAAGGCA